VGRSGGSSGSSYRLSYDTDQDGTAMTTATPITTPFTATSTAAEVIAGIDLTGRRAIVTGGASGIGVETARALAGAGAEVTLAVRDTAAGERTAEDIIATTGNKQILVARLDLADQASVAEFVASWDGPLHILVNNAGVMASPEMRTPEGWELQFATNHLGHFALATGLHDALAAADGARVVSVSSIAHLMSPVVFDDIHFQNRAYEPWLAYGQSKTANVLFAVAATTRWANDGITVNALMPGGIRTNLQRHISDEELTRLRAERGSAGISWKTTEQGAATSVLVATSPLLDGVGGRYFEDCNEAELSQPPSYKGVAAYALDPAAAEQLWQVSLETLAR
jgi:NAD(P)-dependent dehydrogenase (short-subunit alcohol dehydrogenase family)